MSEQIKKCSCCKVEKPITDFYDKKDNKDGKDYYCAYCRKQSRKKYADKNRVRIREEWHKTKHIYSKKRKEYRKNHPEEVRKKDKERHAQENNLYINAKAKNKKRGVAFNLTLLEFCAIRETKACFYCTGPLPVQGYGIDRVDSSKPYEKDNCVPCCTFCNIAKSNHSKDTFLSKIEMIYKTCILSLAK